MHTRRHTLISGSLGLILAISASVPADAQPATTGTRQGHDAIWSTEGSLWSGPPVGEDYRLEISGGLWNPSPSLSASAEQFGIIGTTIDFQHDLGLLQQRHNELRVTLKPGRRHKLRLHWMPMTYRQRAVLEREIIFQGQRFDVGIPVDSVLTWNAWRFGYELDVIVRDRGFLGLIVETKYTDVRAAVDSALLSEFVEARAPIPAIGAIGRLYLTRFTPVTVEFTAFTLPENLVENYQAQLYDVDVYGTVNLTPMVGMTVGYRSMDMSYLFERDAGDFTLDGLYVAGTLRF